MATLSKNTQDNEQRKFSQVGDKVVVNTYPAQALNPFGPPLDADAITVNYPNNLTEVFEYRTGGTTGAVIKTVTVTYNSASKNEIVTVVVS